MELYLSTEGNDEAVGSIKAPIKSIDEAIRRIKVLEEKSVIHLMSGVYRIDKTIFLEKLKNVSFKGCKDSEVVITGGKEFKAEALEDDDKKFFENNPKKDKIKVAKLDEKLSQKPFGMAVPVDVGFPMVIINREFSELSRFPKDEFLKLQNVEDKSFECEEAKDFQFNELWYYGYPKYEWSDYACPIEKESSSFSMESHGKYPIENGTRYHFMNVADAIDENEWAISFENNKIYFCADAESIDVSYLREPLVRTVDCENITFENISFEMTRGNGVENLRGDAIVYKNCRFRNIGKTAVVFGLTDRPKELPDGNWGILGDGGKNCGVEKCDIRDVGMGGVYLSGGNRNKLIPCNNFAMNCNIENYSLYARTYRPGVYLSGVGCVASGNKIHNATHMAIEFEGNEQLIEGNEIYDVLKFSDDASAIYIHCDWTACGNVLRNNYIHDINSGIGDHGTFAMYLDDCAGSAEIYGNYFEGVPCAIFLHGGRNICVHDNVFKDSRMALKLEHQHPDLVEDNKVTLTNRMKTINIMDKAWDKYSYIREILNDEPMEPKYNKVYNNLFINTPFGEIHECVEKNGEIDRGFEL